MCMRIRQALQINILQFVYYNYFCKAVIRRNGHRLIPYKHSVITIDRRARLVLDGDLILNARKIGNSKAEVFLVLVGDAVLHINGETSLRFGSTVQVNPGAKAVFGGFSCNAGINIQCNKSIIIGEDCMFGRNVTVFDSSYHPTGSAPDSMRVNSKEVIIGNHVWVGANSFIMEGVKIGDGCIIGAGCYITENIPSAATVMRQGDKPVIAQNMWARSLRQEDIELATSYYPTVSTVVLKEADLRNELVQEVKTVLESAIAGIDLEHVNNLVSGGYVDSLGLLSILTIIEGRFDINIPFYYVSPSNFDSISAIASLIEKISDKTNQQSVLFGGVNHSTSIATLS